MSISVATPIDRALSRTGDILFRPFDFVKWLTLGFCAFLAYLFDSFGSGGGSSSWSGAPGTGGPGTRSANEIRDWIMNNLGLIISISALVLTILFIITAVLLWLQSRGKFMFLHGLAYNRGEVIAPWKVYRKLGNSLFVFNLVLFVLWWLILFVVLGLCVMIAWPDIQAQDFGGNAVAAIITGGVLMFIIGIGGALVYFALEHFVVPAMYVRMETVLPAWRIAWNEIITAYPGPVILFVLMRILIAIVIGILQALVTCLTCCIAAIPYVGVVIMLPLFVFSRCYTLCFLEQIGPEWQIFEYDKQSVCKACSYDLTGLPPAGMCPECGTAYDHEPTAPPTAPE